MYYFTCTKLLFMHQTYDLFLWNDEHHWPYMLWGNENGFIFSRGQAWINKQTNQYAHFSWFCYPILVLKYYALRLAMTIVLGLPRKHSHIEARDSEFTHPSDFSWGSPGSLLCEPVSEKWRQTLVSAWLLSSWCWQLFTKETKTLDPTQCSEENRG